MRTRYILGPIFIAVVIGLLLIDHLLLPAYRPIGPALVALLALAGWYELARMTGLAPVARGGGGGFLCLGAVAIAFFHAVAWWTGWSELSDAAAEADFERLFLWGIAATVFGAFALAVFRRDFAERYRGVLETIVGVLLLGVLFSYHIRVYFVSERSLLITIGYFLGIKGTDIAAYIVGSMLGRHRLLSVSPKKTVEGCLGGLVWGAVWFGALGALAGDALFPWPHGIVFGIILASAAQVGDLSESMFKRTYGVKDSSVLLPEFGGVLDLVDSLVFTGCLYWYLVATQ